MSLLPTALVALLALAGPALAQDAADADGSGTLLAAEAGQLTLEIDTADLLPGQIAAVYVTDLRPDPRTGTPTAGLRYAGDGQIVWVGDGLIAVDLVHRDQHLPDGAQVVLGRWRQGQPTPAFTPPTPAPPPPPPPAPAPVVVAAAPPPPPPPPVARVPRHGAARAAYADRYGGRRQSTRAVLGWSDDGFGSGLGTAGLAWRTFPAKGPGLIEIGVDGLRGQRWVAADTPVLAAGERWAQEPAVGYWLWTRLDTASAGLALLSGVGLGVDDEGIAAGFLLGLRTGLPHADRIELCFENRGSLGTRVSMDGRVRLSDPVRIGARTRIGNMPEHGGPDFRQARADGVLLLSFDVAQRWTVDFGAGLAGYDLLFNDAGPVLDGALEVRW